jgi:tetratricopeptide (TPR) repeat protein
MRAIGDRGSEAYPLACLSFLARRQGDDALALAHAQSALDIAVAVQDRFVEKLALQALGGAELALGRYSAAMAAFDRSCAIAHSIDPIARYNAAAGLAQVALAQEDAACALKVLEEPLADLFSQRALKGITLDQHFIRLACYEALARAGDPRAFEVLTIAHTELQAQAAKISDTALRYSFLNNIPDHRDIVAAWMSHQHNAEVTAFRK